MTAGRTNRAWLYNILATVGWIGAVAALLDGRWRFHTAAAMICAGGSFVGWLGVMDNDKGDQP